MSRILLLKSSIRGLTIGRRIPTEPTRSVSCTQSRSQFTKPIRRRRMLLAVRRMLGGDPCAAVLPTPPPPPAPTSAKRKAVSVDAPNRKRSPARRRPFRRPRPLNRRLPLLLLLPSSGQRLRCRLRMSSTSQTSPTSLFPTPMPFPARTSRIPAPSSLPPPPNCAISTRTLMTSLMRYGLLLSVLIDWLVDCLIVLFHDQCRCLNQLRRVSAEAS